MLNRSDCVLILHPSEYCQTFYTIDNSFEKYLFELIYYNIWGGGNVLIKKEKLKSLVVHRYGPTKSAPNKYG